jgi:hypothetical protein
MKKLFKFWKYRLEIKLSKMANEQKVEFLANALVKELNYKVESDCTLVSIWIHRKEKLEVESLGYEKISCKYTGK